MTNIYYQSCVHCTIKNTCDLGHTDCDKCGDDYEPYYDDMDMFNDQYDDYYFNDITIQQLQSILKDNCRV